MIVNLQLCLLVFLGNILPGTVDAIGKKCLGKLQRDIAVEESGSVVIKCNNTVNSRIHWYKKVKNDEIFLKNSTLVINEIKRHHSGQYCCVTFENGREIPVERVTLSVQYKPYLHKLLPETQLAQTGSKVMLYCLAEGNPSPHYKWTKEDKELMSNGVNISENTILLEIKSTSDLGIYTCTVSNTVGVTKYRVRVALYHIRTVESSNSITTQSNDCNSNFMSEVIVSCLAGTSSFLLIAWIIIAIKHIKLKRKLLSRDQSEGEMPRENGTAIVVAGQSNTNKPERIARTNCAGTNFVEGCSKVNDTEPVRGSMYYENADVFIGGVKATAKTRQKWKKNKDEGEYTDLFTIQLKKSGEQDYANMPREDTCHYMPLGPDQNKHEEEQKNSKK